MDQLERLRFASRYYPTLQGLRLASFGLAFLYVAAVQPGLVWFPTALSRTGWDLGPPVLSFAAALLANWGLGRYYRREFGVHRPQPRQHDTLEFALLMAAVGAVIAIAPSVLSGVVFGVLFALAFKTSPTLRWYHGIAAATFFSLSILPLFGVGSGREFFGQYSRFHYVVFGTAFTVCGILDHLLLRRLFSPGRMEVSNGHAV